MFLSCYWSSGSLYSREILCSAARDVKKKIPRDFCDFKSGCGDDTAPLPEVPKIDPKPFLARLLDRRSDYPLLPSQQQCCNVFCDDNGKPFVNIQKGFKAACRRAGITDFRFHDLRHTFASHLIMAGVGLRTIQVLLGQTESEIGDLRT